MVTEARVRNFRCLRKVDMHLGHSTVLVGENNSGKTSLLHALHAALGAGARGMTDADVFLSPIESRAPRDRKVIVDVLMRPVEHGTILEEFPADGPWLAHFGEAVSQDANDADQIALRTELAWDQARGEYVQRRRFLTEWMSDPADIESAQAVVGEAPSRRLIEPLSLSYIDANRDIARELHSGGSYWRRLVSDLGLSAEQVAEVEEQLDALNQKLVSESEVLGHLEGHLNDMFKTMAAGDHSVEIAPVQRTLRDLSRGIEAMISTKGGPSFPLDAQGMGTRSLAALLTFRAFVDWRVKKSPNAALHPFVAIEEPEAHLQPQAQRAVFEQLKLLPGQWIISTHSPYICSQAELCDYRVFFKQEGETSVRHLDPEVVGLDDEDVRKIRRQVLNTRGDMLFARGIVLFEGETEEQAVPSFCQRYFATHPNSLGLSLIGTGGSGGYAPFLRLAKTFGIPWWIFTDGEEKAIQDVNAALQKVEEPLAVDNLRVVVLPGGADFETYICAEGRDEALISMVVEAHAQNEQHRATLIEQWDAKQDKISALIAELKTAKTMYASLIPAVLVDLEMPGLLRDLFGRVADGVGIDVGGK